MKPVRQRHKKRPLATPQYDDGYGQDSSRQPTVGFGVGFGVGWSVGLSVGAGDVG